MTEKYYCPKGCKLPTENNLVTQSMHILNKCWFCNHKPLWNKEGKFLGKIENEEEDNK